MMLLSEGTGTESVWLKGTSGVLQFNPVFEADPVRSGHVGLCLVWLPVSLRMEILQPFLILTWQNDEKFFLVSHWTFQLLEI